MRFLVSQLMLTVDRIKYFSNMNNTTDSKCELQKKEYFTTINNCK
jgi:hypothetical protein